MFRRVRGVFAADYEIKMDRPCKVGQRYELTASGSDCSVTTITFRGELVREESTELTAKLRAAVTVLAVDKHERTSRLRLVIGELTATRIGDPKDKKLLAKDTVVVAEQRDGKEVFLVDGKLVDANVQDTLRLLVSLSSDKDPTDDEAFGTKERKKVGDRWVVCGEAIARSLAAQDTKAEAKNIDGAIQLRGVTVVDGAKCLRLAGQFKAKGLSWPHEPGSTIVSGNIAVTLEGILPVDPTLQASGVIQQRGGSDQFRHELQARRQGPGT